MFVKGRLTFNNLYIRRNGSTETLILGENATRKAETGVHFELSSNRTLTVSIENMQKK